MDCNKDEAARAKQISERKFMSKDIVGAKKFALKAQNLYPELDGLNSMLATLDVYLSAENQICGESDWYGVLAVHPLDDDETIRRQYRKLALMLHPDKNKSIGAEGAFKFISQAWSLLSDKTKRLLYDQKRSSYLNKQQPSSSGYAARNSNGSNVFFNFSKGAKVGSSHKPKPSTASHKEKSANVSSSSKPTSFWTCCNKCKMQYEYLSMYLNHNLLCPNCHKPFIAHETKPPGTKEWNFSGKQQQNSSRQNRQKNKNEWGPFSKGVSDAYAAQAADMVRQTYNKVKREREEAQAAVKREEALRRKIRKTSSLQGNSKKRKGVDDLGGGCNPTVLASGARSISLSLYSKNKNLEQDNASGISKIQLLLIEKARMEIRNKLKEWSSANSEVESPKKSEEIQRETLFSDTVATEKYIQPISVEVLDSEFHNFDMDRTESCFGEKEVWAAYDDDDGMPRHYAFINKLISSDPFKIQICWLNARIYDNLDTLGFPVTCGEFRIGKNETSNSPYLFSHKVKCSKYKVEEFHIYPRKGEVWALYRNWSPQWNEFTDAQVIHKYDIVEVIKDYDDHENDEEEEGEIGITVIPLVKVAGFKTVFHHHLDPKEKKKIPQQETYRFSHQIPSYLITGQETLNAPTGCWELDPAAIPPEFLEVITYNEDIDLLQIEEKSNERNLKED